MMIFATVFGPIKNFGVTHTLRLSARVSPILITSLCFFLDPRIDFEASTDYVHALFIPLSSTPKSKMTEFLPSNIDVDDMFRPPINRAMRVLDRSFFQKKIPTLAALILNPKNTSKFKTELYNDTLKLDRMQAIKVLHDAKGQKKKGIMLKPNIKKDGGYGVVKSGVDMY